jgi:hypothetical protein
VFFVKWPGNKKVAAKTFVNAPGNAFETAKKWRENRDANIVLEPGVA